MEAADPTTLVAPPCLLALLPTELLFVVLRFAADAGRRGQVRPWRRVLALRLVAPLWARAVVDLLPARIDFMQRTTGLLFAGQLAAAAHILRHGAGAPLVGRLCVTLWANLPGNEAAPGALLPDALEALHALGGATVGWHYGAPPVHALAPIAAACAALRPHVRWLAAKLRHCVLETAMPATLGALNLDEVDLEGACFAGDVAADLSALAGVPRLVCPGWRESDLKTLREQPLRGGDERALLGGGREVLDQYGISGLEFMHAPSRVAVGAVLATWGLECTVARIYGYPRGNAARTLLDRAAASAAVDVVAHLLRLDAAAGELACPLDVPGACGASPLNLALHHVFKLFAINIIDCPSYEHIIELLLAAGAWPGARVAGHPLYWALLEVESDAPWRALERICGGLDFWDVHARDCYGRTLLHVAATAHRLWAVRALLARGAVVDALDDEGATPLLALAGELDDGDSDYVAHEVVEHVPGVIEALLEAGAAPRGVVDYVGAYTGPEAPDRFAVLNLLASWRFDAGVRVLTLLLARDAEIVRDHERALAAGEPGVPLVMRVLPYARKIGHTPYAHDTAQLALLVNAGMRTDVVDDAGQHVRARLPAGAEFDAWRALLAEAGC